MTSLLATMTPIFGLVFLGFVAVKLRFLEGGGVRGLVLFVFNFAIPALLLRSVADLDPPADIEWGFLYAFYGGSLLTYGLGMAVGRFGFGRGMSDQGIFGMTSSHANLVMVGIPIVLTAFGPESALPMLLLIAFQSITLMPITIVLIQWGRGRPEHLGRQLGTTLLELLRNPIIVSILLGAALNLGGVTLWKPLGDSVDLLGTAAIPCALFALGASLAGYPLQGALAPAAAMTTLKLVVHPILVWVLAVPVLGLEGLAVSVAVVLAGMPSAVNSYLFGARYDVAADVAARTVFLSSICSAATIAVLLALHGP